MIFQRANSLAVAYSIHFQHLVAQRLLIFNKFVLPSFALIGGRSYVFRPYLSRFLVFQNIFAEF